LAKPAGLYGSAAPAAGQGQRRLRADGGGKRDGGAVECACRQWSSGHPRMGTLVRHFMCDIAAGVCRDVGILALRRTQRGALAPAPRPCGVMGAPATRALIATGRLAPGQIVRLAPAGAAAISVASIASAAQDDLSAASGAQEQTRCTVQLRHQTGPVVLDGLVPARHTAVAPPSSARCRARHSHQASRRERAVAVPTSFGWIGLYSRTGNSAKQARPSRCRQALQFTASDRDGFAVAMSLGAARSPCRATGQSILHRIDSARTTSSLEPLPHGCSNPKPRPRHHIVAVLDQRSQLESELQSIF